jgi:predicted O-linked N-acetylglucosamine transferase (SPINDLY family)
VIAFAGDRHAARVSISILEHAGFAAFAGVDLADYKRLARDWARKPEALQQLRREMRPRLSRSALCDAPGFAATIDAAFTALVQT